MRKAILLLLCWALGLGGHYGELAAQGRAAGPWRVISQPVRYKLYREWGSAEEWGEKPSPTSETDTATTVRVQRKLYRVPWNVHPDSITLFLDCQNPLLAPAVPRGQLAPVRFKATGATVRLDAKQRLLLLVPSAPVVVLWAYRGQRLAFRHEFKAVSPPLPIIHYFGSECGMGCKPAIYTTYIRTITLRAVPDKDFAAMLPDDARYRVAQFRTTLLRQGKPIELVSGQPAALLIDGPQCDLSNLESVARLGDQLQTDVLMIQRQNFQHIVTSFTLEKSFLSSGPVCPESRP